MKKSVTTLGMLTGFGLAATLFLGCQDFVGGKDDSAPAVKTDEDGGAHLETDGSEPSVSTFTEQPPVSMYTEKPPLLEQTVTAAVPAGIDASPPAGTPPDSAACSEIGWRITAAKGEANITLRDSLYNAGMAEWVAMDCASLTPPPPYISPEQKCLDAKYQLEATEREGYGPGTKYYQTWLDEVNKRCTAVP